MKKKNLLLTAVATLGLVTATIAQVPNYVPTNGLVGYWPFNGNANDESGNGFNATNTNATLTIDRFGVTDAAYYFNGTSARMSLPNLGVLTEFSFSVWVKSNGADGVNNRAFFGSTGNWSIGHIHSGAEQNEMRVALCDGGTNNFISTNAFNLDSTNKWYHISYTFKPLDTAKLYIDGVLMAQVNTSNQTLNLNTIYFGFEYLLAGDRYWNGNLDDFGIWNRALTQEEITQLYNGNLCYEYITVTDTLIINTNITGFNPVTYENTIKIYPNPTNDHITIDYGNYANLNGYQLKIINSLSQEVFQTSITQQQSYVDLSSWSGNGLYFVHLIDAQGNIIDIRKIVLQ